MSGNEHLHLQKYLFSSQLQAEWIPILVRDKMQSHPQQDWNWQHGCRFLKQEVNDN